MSVQQDIVYFTRPEFAEALRVELMTSRIFKQVTRNIGDYTGKRQFFEEWLAGQKSLAHIERYVAL